jgi:vacuolar-type H+-ATPase subunit F/Vma7
MKIIGFCDENTAIALRLVGITETIVPQNNAVQLWNQLIERDDIGIIFVTEHMAEILGKYLQEFRNLHTVPIIVEIPDAQGRKKDHVDYISHLIKKAVGVEVKR